MVGSHYGVNYRGLDGLRCLLCLPHARLITHTDQFNGPRDRIDSAVRHTTVRYQQMTSPSVSFMVQVERTPDQDPYECLKDRHLLTAVSSECWLISSPLRKHVAASS